MSGQIPFQNDPTAAFEHVEYEMRMLKAVAEELSSSTHTTWVYNALVESFAIHTRVLLDFFYKPRKYRDDVVAEDYVQNWSASCPPKTPDLTDATIRVDKEIVHLTYVRLMRSGSGKDWRFAAITQDLVKVCGAFIALIPVQSQAAVSPQVELTKALAAQSGMFTAKSTARTESKPTQDGPKWL